MERQLSLELNILSSGKRQNSFPIKHLSSKKEKKPKQQKKKRGFEKSKDYEQLPLSTKENIKKQLVSNVLPKTEKKSILDLYSLSLEEDKGKQVLKTSFPKEIAPKVQTFEEQFSNYQRLKEELFFLNKINLISVKTVAEMLGLAPKTIHNWVYLRKIPYVKCGHKVMFRPKSLKAWLNRKEKEAKSWL